MMEECGSCCRRCPDVLLPYLPPLYALLPSLTRGDFVYPDHDMMSLHVRETILCRLDGGN